MNLLKRDREVTQLGNPCDTQNILDVTTPKALDESLYDTLIIGEGKQKIQSVLI